MTRLSIAPVIPGSPAPDVSTLALISEFERSLRDRCDLLRQTAEELRTGAINQYRAANRITKIANEIAAGGER